MAAAVVASDSAAAAAAAAPTAHVSMQCQELRLPSIFPAVVCRDHFTSVTHGLCLLVPKTTNDC